MKIELEDIEPCVKKITVEVPAERVDEEKSAIFRELAKSASAPGFRKGRVPKSMLEKMYARSVLSDAAQKLIQDAYREAIETHNLRPASDPVVDDVRIDEKQPLVFTATVEIFPDVKIKDVSAITLKRRVAKVDDAEVDRIIDHYRERSARFEPVEGRPVEEGDFAVIDYSATRGGAPVESFKGENRQVQVSRDNMLEGFYSGIIGMSRGEEKEFEAALPKEFPDPDMAGSSLVFRVKVNEIKRKALPEANDEFAREVSEFDTIGQFRADLRSSLEKRNRSAADNGLREDLLTRLIEDNPFDLAAPLVKRQADALARRSEKNLRGQGIDPKDIGLDQAAVMDKSIKDADRMLREQVILSAYGRDAGIDVTGEDVDAEIEKIARMMGQDSGAARAQLMESGAISNVAHQAFTEKVYAAIMDKIKIEDEIIEKANDEKRD